ncbi:hypothetical protein MA16_Dca008488 [Dendrobium catenatum]|uniref:Uncharacterized protein n=1 Tax=Dendrobium catenatum TaxID=906689 RepID=A0A2I0XHK4_9ASPA|nr:hypothetical protein MA16_Dca008488 [Dendrobium catenatum]
MGLDGSPTIAGSHRQRKKTFVVIGINTAFSSRKRSDYNFATVEEHIRAATVEDLLQVAGSAATVQDLLWVAGRAATVEEQMRRDSEKNHDDTHLDRASNAGKTVLLAESPGGKEDKKV